MADKDRRPSKGREEHPETEPYAPPRHPDVHVPEQQFEGDPDKEHGKPSEERRDHPSG
jgi:hypothetical protein